MVSSVPNETPYEPTPFLSYIVLMISFLFLLSYLSGSLVSPLFEFNFFIKYQCIK